MREGRRVRVKGWRPYFAFLAASVAILVGCLEQQPLGEAVDGQTVTGDLSAWLALEQDPISLGIGIDPVPGADESELFKGPIRSPYFDVRIPKDADANRIARIRMLTFAKVMEIDPCMKRRDWRSKDADMDRTEISLEVVNRLKECETGYTVKQVDDTIYCFNGSSRMCYAFLKVYDDAADTVVTIPDGTGTPPELLAVYAQKVSPIPRGLSRTGFAATFIAKEKLSEADGKPVWKDTYGRYFAKATNSPKFQSGSATVEFDEGEYVDLPKPGAKYSLVVGIAACPLEDAERESRIDAVQFERGPDSTPMIVSIQLQSDKTYVYVGGEQVSFNLRPNHDVALGLDLDSKGARVWLDGEKDYRDVAFDSEMALGALRVGNLSSKKSKVNISGFHLHGGGLPGFAHRGLAAWIASRATEGKDGKRVCGKKCKGSKDCCGS